MTAAAVLSELRRRGAVAWRVGDRIRVRPAEAVDPEIAAAVRAHRPELLAALPAEPPAEAAPALTAATDAPAPPRTWLLGGSTGGEMRLSVVAEPPWPDPVYRAAALVEVVDAHHRAGNERQALAAALQLEDVLAELRRQGIEAWLTC